MSKKISTTKAKWMQSAVNPGRKGDFTAKAKQKGMSVQAYANQVTQPESKASTRTKQQANFAKTAARIGKGK